MFKARCEYRLELDSQPGQRALVDVFVPNGLDAPRRAWIAAEVTVMASLLRLNWMRAV